MRKIENKKIWGGRDHLYISRPPGGVGVYICVLAHPGRLYWAVVHRYANNATRGKYGAKYGMSAALSPTPTKESN